MKLSEDIQELIDGIDSSINGSSYRQSFVWIKEDVEKLENRNKEQVDVLQRCAKDEYIAGSLRKLIEEQLKK